MRRQPGGYELVVSQCQKCVPDPGHDVEQTEQQPSLPTANRAQQHEQDQQDVDIVPHHQVNCRDTSGTEQPAAEQQSGRRVAPALSSSYATVWSMSPWWQPVKLRVVGS